MVMLSGFVVSKTSRMHVTKLGFNEDSVVARQSEPGQLRSTALIGYLENCSVSLVVL